MPDNKESETYEWVESADRYPPFPTDYTRKELETRWKINADDIRDYILNLGKLGNFFLWMRYAHPDKLNKENKKEKKGKKGKKEEKDKQESPKKPVKGVPAELEPFFKVYIDEAIKFNEDYARRSQELTGIQKSKKWLKDCKEFSEFEYQFCKKLNELVMKENTMSKDGTSLDNDYWYRRLYDNEAFQTNISQAYWEQEYEIRCKRLRELSLQLPQDLQILQLQHAILNMDTQIAAMLYVIKRDGFQGNGYTGSQSFIESFPKEFIENVRTRRITRQDINARARYFGHNFQITIDTSGCEETKKLSDFFDDMKDHNKRVKIREAIRPHYLKDVCTVPEKTPFQNACEQLQQYLNYYIDKDETNGEVEKYIIYRLKTYFIPLLWFGASPTGIMAPGANHSVGTYTVIDELIASMYTDFYIKHINTIGYICRGSYNLEKEIERINRQFEEDESNGCQRECTFRRQALYYSEMVHSVCIYKIPTHNNLRKCVLSQKEICRISKEMEKSCIELHERFLVEPRDWMNEANFIKLWERYNDVLTTYDGTVDLAATTEEDVKLCSALLWCNVLDTLDRVKEVTLGSYLELKKYLTERAGS